MRKCYGFALCLALAASYGALAEVPPTPVPGTPTEVKSVVIWEPCSGDVFLHGEAIYPEFRYQNLKNPSVIFWSYEKETMVNGQPVRTVVYTNETASFRGGTGEFLPSSYTPTEEGVYFLKVWTDDPACLTHQI